MRKKVLIIVMGVAIALTAGFALNQQKEEVSLSDMVLNNVEALASNEGGDNGKALAQKRNGDYCCATLAGNNCNSSPDC